jgi:hypothetical protein
VDIEEQDAVVGVECICPSDEYLDADWYVRWKRMLDSRWGSSRLALPLLDVWADSSLEALDRCFVSLELSLAGASAHLVISETKKHHLSFAFSLFPSLARQKSSSGLFPWACA